MKRQLTGLWIAVAVLAVIAWHAPSARETHAQIGGDLPPTIISFTSDLASIPLAEAEAGNTLALLEWQTVGVRPGQQLLLHTYQVNAWVPLLPADAAPLPTSGNLEVTVQHPRTFGPPTYSLMIVDAQARVLDQRILIIAYEQDETAGAPTIERFTASVETLDASAVANGSARVTVNWAVINRRPADNLVFEQVLEGGRAVSVELPRPNLWVASAGEGVVAPVMPPTGEPVRLRLRVVDMQDGSTLDEKLLPPIALTASIAVPPSGGAIVTTPPASAPGVQVVAFNAAPETVARGGTVTISWLVTGTDRVTVWQLLPTGQYAQQAPVMTPSGVWTVTLADYYVDSAHFLLNATDAAGNLVQAALTVRVICPYTYFFGPADGLPCPAGPAGTVQAAFQIFENGYMIWRADTSEILVLYRGTGLVSRFRDSWQGETITYPETPPDGLYQPVRGFGRVWVDNPQVRGALGWAVTLEQGYTMQYQTSGDFKYARQYLTWPDGTVVYIVENSWAFK